MVFMKISLQLILASVVLAAEARGAGVAVGASSLIGSLQYSDTYTLSANGGIAGRPDNVYPVGVPGIAVESSYGNPARAWQDGLWSLNTDASVFPGSSYAGGTGAGSATGITQTGGGWDGSFEYGLSSSFVVQFDSAQAIDRVNIFTGTTGNIAGGMSVFFRTTGHPVYPEIGIYNGAVEVNSGLTSGIGATGEWHNYAVAFTPTALSIYVDQSLRGTIDLTTFNGGSFLGYSNAFVGAGNTGATTSAGFPISWSDNFQVGLPVPEPGVAVLGLVAGGVMLRRRRVVG
jgi:hypothetical protein